MTQHPATASEARLWLAHAYVEQFGYDPFEDSPAIDPLSVACTLFGCWCLARGLTADLDASELHARFSDTDDHAARDWLRAFIAAYEFFDV